VGFISTASGKTARELGRGTLEDKREEKKARNREKDLVVCR